MDQERKDRVYRPRPLQSDGSLARLAGGAQTPIRSQPQAFAHAEELREIGVIAGKESTHVARTF